jgi:hypothetical protein
VVKLLESAPTDAESFQAFLESKVDPRLRGLIDRLLGRVGDKLPKKTLERRLARLREWAQTVDEALTDAATIDQRLRTEIEKIHDRVGFVVAFTIDRTTRRATVLDVELDPSSKGCRQAFRALCQGKIDEFTEKLPFEKDPESEDDLDQPDPDFRLHHFVLTTDRSTAATWLFSPSVGAGTKRITKAFDSSRIEIRQSNGAFDRQGSYSGGVVQTTGAAKEGMLRSWMGSIWLTSEAHAEDPSLQAPYTRTRHVLRFATLRFDDDLKARRRVGLDEMLRFLGFGPGAVTSRVPAEATATRIEAELLLQSSADSGEEIDPIDGLLAPLRERSKRVEKGLDAAFLDAAQGWLGEPLIESRFGSLDWNRVLPRIVATRDYRERWRRGPWDEPLLFHDGPRVLRVRPTPEAEGDSFAPVLHGLALARSWGSKSLAQLGRAWGTVTEDSTSVAPESLISLSRAFRRAVRKNSPQIAFWSSPLFQHWLIFTRLRKHIDRGLLGLRGVASISWRLGEDEWQPPRRVVIR